MMASRCFKQTTRQVQQLVFDSMMQHEFWSKEVVERRISAAYSNWPNAKHCPSPLDASWSPDTMKASKSCHFNWTTFEILWNRNPWTNLRNRKALLDTSHSWLFWIHQISPGHSGHESPCYLDICETSSDQAITSEAQIHRGFRKVSQLRHFVAKASKVQQLQPLRIWSVLTYTCNEQN